MLLNHGSKWLVEDDMNLLELIAEENKWDTVSFILQRSINACKLRYGMLRMVNRLKDQTTKISKLIIMKPIKRKKEK